MRVKMPRDIFHQRRKGNKVSLPFCLGLPAIFFALAWMSLVSRTAKYPLVEFHPMLSPFVAVLCRGKVGRIVSRKFIFAQAFCKLGFCVGVIYKVEIVRQIFSFFLLNFFDPFTSANVIFTFIFLVNNLWL